MQDFEKLGVFYLGREHDLSSKSSSDHLILYDSKDLVTHAVCVGMTGSGKTGLCIALLEEAAIDGIPAIIIDPKGDLTNLLLTFPQLRAEDFRPWVNEDDARKKGLSVDQFAQQQADFWKQGLQSWGEDGARIGRLKDAADFAIYTPGSNAGLGVSILKSFAAPEPAIRDDSELLRDRVATTATSLLGLLGIDADPIQSREHILISTLLGNAWSNGQDLDLAALIAQIQKPPVSRIGVLDLESFYSSKDRFALAMRLNNLLAAPGFSSWLEGQPLDIAEMLHTQSGKPRHAIFSIAHLSDSERMFFVSLLLNQVLGWMRQQPGTTSLRAIVYMDEIFGYFPPTANPPSKQPLLTLMKQARAFGVGMVLATQNPVDLDYKGLSNAGTWFIGRLQTDRDKGRLLDGLEGAAAGTGQKFDRATMEQTLAGLGDRVFLMNNVHDDAPVTFESRWAMSYLRGPLTRQQIKMLMDPVRASIPSSSASEAKAQPAGGGSPASEAPARGAASSGASARPVLPPGIPQGFIPLRSNPPPGATLVYHPALLGCGKIYFADSKTGVNQEQDSSLLASLTDQPVAADWSQASEVELDDKDLDSDPQPGASFAALPSSAGQAKNYESWKKQFADALYRGRSLQLFKCDSLDQTSKPGESERDFRVRLSQSAREQRDAAVEKLKTKFAPKFTTLNERLRRAQQAEETQRSQASASRWSAVISAGATVLGAFLGRRAMSIGTLSRAGAAARGVSRSYKEAQDVAHANETVQAVQQQLNDLNSQFQEESNQLAQSYDPQSIDLESISIRPKKSNITVRSMMLAWAPYWQVEGKEAPAWK